VAKVKKYLPTAEKPVTLPPRAVTDGWKEKNLGRRRHQEGQLLKLQHGWAVRLYEDYFDDGARKRRRVQKYLGDFEKLPTRRSAQNAMMEQLGRVNDFSAQPRTTQTFGNAAWQWIAETQRRKKKPVKPSVLCGWKSMLRIHILPLIGEVPISDVKNRTMRSLVESLVAKKLSPSTIRNITNVVKFTLASITDDDGNAMYNTTWNAKVIDAPNIDPAKQHRPTLTSAEAEQIVKTTSGRLQMAAVLLTSTGIRAGELLGLECRHFDGASIHIKQELWRGQVLDPKTPNARRIVDLHPDAASLLKQFLGNRSTGFIFQTRNGRPMNQRNLARSFYNVLDDLGISRRGFHSFRRYRNTHLRKLHCPDGLLKFWMGHAAESDMSDRYDRVRDDVDFRRDVARSLGVGFELPKKLSSGSPGPKEEVLGVIGRQAELLAPVSC